MTAKRSGFRRILRWLRNLVLLAALLVAAAVLSQSLWLPSLTSKLAADQGLDLRYDDLDLWLLGGSFSLTGVQVRELPPEGAPEDAPPLPLLARVDYVHLDADFSALLTGDLRVHRVELDGVDAWVERDAEGAWNFDPLLERWASDAQPKQPAPSEEEPPESAAEPQPWDLRSPVRIDAIRAQGLRLHYVDALATPALDTRFDLHLELSDIGVENTPARLRLSADAPEVLDGLRVDGTVESAESELAARLEVDLFGLHLARCEHLLADAGIRPVAQQHSFRLLLEADLAVPGADPQSLTGELRLRDVALTADLQPAVTLAELTLPLEQLSADRLALGDALLVGLSAGAARGADGTLRVAGLDLIGAPAAAVDGASAETQPAQPAGDAAAAPTPTPARAQALQLGAFRLADARLAWSDAAVDPAVALDLGLGATLTDLALGTDAEPKLELDLQLPGVWESLRLTGSGRLVEQPGGASQQLSLQLMASGLQPDALAPYLRGAGIEHELREGALRAGVELSLSRAGAGPDQTLELSADVTEFVLEDGQPLAGVERLSVRLTQEPGGTQIHSLDLEGTSLELRRDAQGALHVAGLVLGGGAATRAPVQRAPVDRAPPAAGGVEPPAAAAPPGPAGPQDPPTRLRIDQVRWAGTRVHYIDESTETPVDLTLDDLGLELAGLDLFGDPARPAPEAARLRTWFQATGLASELGLEGTLAVAPGPLDLRADLQLTGRGLVTDAIAPLLEQAGVLSELQGASLDLGLEAHARQDGEEFALDAALRELAYSDGGEELLALDARGVEGLRSGPQGTTLAGLDVRSPRLVARRDAAGGLHAGGFHLPPAEPVEASAEAEDKPAAAASAPAANPAKSSDIEAETETEAPAPAPFRAERIQLTGLRLGWADDAVQPEVDTAVSGDLRLEGVDTAPGAAPAVIVAELGLDDAFEALRLDGSLQADPADAALDLDIELRGMGGRSIAAYLPPGLEFQTGTTQLLAKAQAEFAAIEGGAHRALLDLRDVELAAGPDAEPDLVLRSLRLGAPLLDDAGQRFELDGVLVEGFELRLERTGERSFELAGLALEAPAPAEPAENPEGAAASAPVMAPAMEGEELAASEASAADDQPGEEEFALEEDAALVELSGPEAEPGQPGAPESAAPATAVGTRPVLQPAAAPPPTVTTGPLAIGPLRVTYVDRTRPELDPLVASVSLVSSAEQTLVAPEPGDLPPLELRLVAGLDPLVESVAFDLTLAPWATDPGATCEVQVRGLRGERLERVLPEVAASLSLDDLPNGSFDAHLETTLSVRRRGPLDLGLDRDFGLDFLLRDLALLPEPGAEPVLSLASLEVEADRIVLGTGDMRFKRVEVVRPMAHAVQDAEGLHVAGVTFPPAVEEQIEDGAEALADAEVDLDPDGTAASPGETSADSGVIEVQSLSITGLQASYTDETTEPRTYLPVRDMELEARGFSTLALTEPRPIRVQGYLDAGLLELPERKPSGSLLKGVLGAASSLVAGGGNYETEERYLWDQLEFSSRMTLAPAPKGWVRTNLLGLELPAFRGLASGAGVQIGDGLMDTQVTVRFYGEDGLGLQTSTQFDYLSLSEPADGPISRYLVLPAPLDTVLFLLRNESGQQKIPLNVRMNKDGVSTSQIASAAANVLGQLVGEAVAASPMRLGGTLTDLVGLTGSSVPTSTETSHVKYVAGAVTPEGGLETALAPLIERMRQDPDLNMVLQHELGPGDLAIADRLANPGAEALGDLLERLRSRKAELLRRRFTQAAQVQALYQVGETAAGDGAASELRRLDRELLETDQGLTDLLERMRPGAERRASRRARNAGRAIAQERLDRVESALLRSGVRRIYDRIDVRRPKPTDLRVAAEGEPELPADLGGRISCTPRPRK